MPVPSYARPGGMGEASMSRPMYLLQLVGYCKIVRRLLCSSVLGSTSGPTQIKRGLRLKELLKPHRGPQAAKWPLLQARCSARATSASCASRGTQKAPA